MTTFIQAIKQACATIQGRSELPIEKGKCNYADNYYGDQVCLLVKANP